MRDLNARLVLAHPSLLQVASRAAKAANIPLSHLYTFSNTPQVSIDNIHDWATILGSHSEASFYHWPFLSAEAAANTIATINYSSGTTGLPKGVMITHTNLIANLEQNINMAQFERPGVDKTPLESERWLGFLPLYHAFGQLVTILMAAKLQRRVYVLTAFIFEDFLRAIQLHRITEVNLAPPVLVLLHKSPLTSNFDLSSLHDLSCGAAPLSRELQNQCTKKLNVNIRQAWGMTELTCGGIVLPPGLTDDTGSVGMLLPNETARLLDESGNEVLTGQRGELYICGPNVSVGYWKNEKATVETMLPGGWLRTGDVAVANEKGYFWIVDRLKELIKVSGQQVAPAELEAVLLSHPAIADAGVVGVSDSFTGQEQPRAYVLRKSVDNAKEAVAAEEIASWIETKVAKHKRLTGGVVFVKEVPKSAAGKIQRKILREWAKEATAAKGGKSKL